jgi:hypothetical protein
LFVTRVSGFSLLPVPPASTTPFIFALYLPETGTSGPEISLYPIVKLAQV